MKQLIREERGFTLVEIMTVVLILGVLSAMSMPLFTRIRISANEGAAQEALSTFRSAMTMFYTSSGRYPIQLTELGTPVPPYVDPLLSNGSRQGYDFLYEDVTPATFTIVAVPQVPNFTGVRWFSLKESGEIEALDGTQFAEQTINVRKFTSLSKSSRWFRGGDEMWTNWGGHWLEYEVDFGSAGNFNVGVSARNHFVQDIPPPPAYKFDVEVYVDGKLKGHLFLDADNHKFDHKEIKIEVPAGIHTVQYRWINDEYKAGVHDANIRLKDVTIQRSFR